MLLSFSKLVRLPPWRNEGRRRRKSVSISPVSIKRKSILLDSLRFICALHKQAKRKAWSMKNRWIDRQIEDHRDRREGGRAWCRWWEKSQGEKSREKGRNNSGRWDWIDNSLKDSSVHNHSSASSDFTRVLSDSLLYKKKERKERQDPEVQEGWIYNEWRRCDSTDFPLNRQVLSSSLLFLSTDSFLELF